MDNDDRLRGSEQPNRRQFLLTAGSTVAAGVVAAYAPTRAATVAEVETLAVDVAVPALGKIGVAGIAAAITDAVHHVTGFRVRELPVKIENLLV